MLTACCDKFSVSGDKTFPRKRKCFMMISNKNPYAESRSAMHTPTSPVSKLVNGLPLRMLEGVLTFDRITPLRCLATAALRGLAGHLLHAASPELTRKYFKPGDTRPSALVFQPVHGGGKSSLKMPFRLISWSADHDWLQVLLSVFQTMPGCPFAETGAVIESVHLSELQELQFETEPRAITPARITLHTPLMIRKGRRPIGEADLQLPALISAAVRRINRISRHYGNGQTLDEALFRDLAGHVLEIGRDVEWVSPRRRSSVQGRNISLSGWVGNIDFDALPPELADLFNLIACIHLGRHTMEGCGHLAISHSRKDRRLR